MIANDKVENPGRALTTAKGKGDLIHDLNDLLQLAGVLVKSGLLPKDVRTPEAAAVIILKGRELGIGPMEAFGGINVIQGKPTVSPALMLALINRSGQLQNLSIQDDGETCAVIMTRSGRQPHRETFSVQDSKLMGLADRDNWQKQPKTMRKWRAVSACARVVFPDVIEGAYLPEELGADVNEDGEIIEAETPVRGQASLVVPVETAHPGAEPERVSPPSPVSLPDPATAPTAHLPPAPIITSKQADRGGNDNGKAKRAMLRTGLWKSQVLNRAIEAEYVPDDSTGSGIRLLNVIGAAGIPEVTDDNLTQAWQAVQTHYGAKKEKATPERSVPALSAVQRRKLVELYRNLNGGGEEEAYRGLDSLFIESCRHGLAEASYQEGARITAQLLAAQRAR